MIRLHSSPFVLAFLVWLGTAESSLLYAQLPFQRQPIAYSASSADDPVADLIRTLKKGDDALVADKATGYLSSLLRHLEVPVSSQVLVYSKTSLQKHLISPANPRAIYFSDDVYVAWVPNGTMIEIAATDPSLGTIFYTVDQPSVGSETASNATIVRKNDRCLFCHASSDTGRIPGLLMRSVYTDAGGNRVFPVDAIRAASGGPLEGRWAGWFVSGTHGKQRHLGNLTVNEGGGVAAATIESNANLTDLSPRVDVGRYPSPHSDIVALLVLRHQITIHNLLTDANHRARIRLHQSDDRDQASSETTEILDALAEQVVDGILMLDEPGFSDRIVGTSSFAADFAKRGPTDAEGRGLREFDLRTRLFRRRCSFLIYSDSFDQLPPPLLRRVHGRLLRVLSSQDRRAKYAHLPVSERKEILEILRETKTGLPPVWGD